MTDIETYIINQLKQLVPSTDEFQVRANIGDNSCSMEFFVTLDGIKHQCYDLIDGGVIKEMDFDSVVKDIAKYIRTTSDYQPGKINKFSFIACT